MIKRTEPAIKLLITVGINVTMNCLLIINSNLESVERKQRIRDSHLNGIRRQITQLPKENQKVYYNLLYGSKSSIL